MKHDTPLRILGAFLVFIIVASLEWLCGMPLLLIFGVQPVLFLLVFALEEYRAKD